jgi:hypothetical protein
LHRVIAAFIPDRETDLLFNHSSRVYRFGASAGKQRSRHFDPALLFRGEIRAVSTQPLSLAVNTSTHHKRF